MSVYRLRQLFSPRGVAVAGASMRSGSLGKVVWENLRAAGFAGPLYAVNPKHEQVFGVRCWARIGDLPTAPDLLVVATPPASVVSVIADAASAGVATAVRLTAGLGKGPGSIAQSALDIARASGLRLLGPNCLGLLCPPSCLNASFSAQSPRPGDLALISQSGAVAAGVVAWAQDRNIGFSAVVSLGDGIDIDFGDCLDYFAEDPATRAILLYVEGVTDAHKFMSAARAAARAKPVIVLKAGRHAQAAHAATTHTGALAGSDPVYEAAFRRAGLIRAVDLDDLFAAAETLARRRPFEGDRIAIVTNGGGLGVLAVDRLIDLGVRIAQLSPATLARLDRCLPATWSRSNPVDIIGDAPPQRYAEAMRAVLEEPQADAVLVMNCPTGLTAPGEARDAVLRVLEDSDDKTGAARPVFSVWLGADEDQRNAFTAAGVPAFASESEAARGIAHLVNYRRRLDELTRTPRALHRSPDRSKADAALQSARSAKRRWLDPMETADILAAYEIPAAPVRLAADGPEAAAAAQPFIAAGQACAVKIHSPDITHKSDVDGVRLNLTTGGAVKAAAEEIIANAVRCAPKARIRGVTVQPMIVRPHALELIAGVANDPTFGYVVAFGHGGVAVELLDDVAFDLLPVNSDQARALVGRTRIARLLDGYRNVAPTNREAIVAALVGLSRLVEDFPDIASLDLNPLLADSSGVLAVDARIELAATVAPGPKWRRFALRPYPRELEHETVLRGGERLWLRPIRPEDEPALATMLSRASPEDLRLRFHAATRSFDRIFIARLTQLDYSRAMAFVAIEPQSKEIVGVARLHCDANHESAEFAILVRTDWKNRGLGWRLMTDVIRFARSEELRVIWGHILAENDSMLRMCAELGFEIGPVPGDVSLKVARLAIEKASDIQGAGAREDS